MRKPMLRVSHRTTKASNSKRERVVKMDKRDRVAPAKKPRSR